MDWNEFNKHLQNRVSDPGVRYCLGIVYERLLDVAKQVDMCAEICTALAETMNNFVALNEQFDQRLKTLNKHVKGQVDGVELSSVSLNDDDE